MDVFNSGKCNKHCSCLCIRVRICVYCDRVVLIKVYCNGQWYCNSLCNCQWICEGYQNEYLFDCRVILVVCACKLYSCFVGGIRVCTYCGRVALSALQTEPTGYMHIERDDLGNSTEVEQSSYQIWGTKGAAGGRLSSDLISTR